MGLSGFSGTDSGLCHGRECPELFLFKKKRKAKNNCPSPSNALTGYSCCPAKKIKNLLPFLGSFPTHHRHLIVQNNISFQYYRGLTDGKTEA